MASAIHFPFARIAQILGSLTIGASLFLLSPGAHAGDAAETFVQSRIAAGSGILRDSSLTPDMRHQQFHDFVLSITDMRRVALFTIGTYARDAKEADIARFVTAFTEFSVDFYEHALDGFVGQAIRLTGSARRSEDDAIVSAEIADPRSKTRTLKAAFRVRKNERGDPVITDFQVEGAWLALTQRSEFMSFLQRHHGDVVQLSDELEKRAKENNTHASHAELRS